MSLSTKDRWVLDRPNSYIGRSVPRPNAKRLLEGRGTFVDDISLPRMLQVVFVRSPYAHARILSIDTSAAEQCPGVVGVVTGKQLAEHHTPWVGVLHHLEGLVSAPQHAIAVEHVCWQGEAVAAIVAHTREQAEDAVDGVLVEWEALPAVCDPETALDADTPLIHEDLGSNLAWERSFAAGDVDKAFAEADTVVEETFEVGRHTGVPLEPRSILADFNPGEHKLTVYQSTQAPHMMQSIFAKHLDMDEGDVRVICKDVGGSFGIKVHVYADEFATVALSRLFRRPVKFIADRLESFVTDIHARDHIIRARLAVSREGKFEALEIDDLTGIGPYSMYPRTSGIEANQIVNLTGGPYQIPNYKARARVVFQNKGVMCQYRAVGHPVACLIAEGLVDQAARKIDMDPVEIRRRNLYPDDAYPCKSVTGMAFENLSHHQSIDKLMDMMDYQSLRKEQAEMREKGIYRGIGLASFIEVTNPGPMFYGVGGAPISAQDGCTLRLDGKGNIICATGVTEQGQGTEAVIAQIVATSVGVPLEKIRVITGDTEITPYGGGTWGSRGCGIAGEAAAQAGRALRDNILDAAGVMLHEESTALDIQNGAIVDLAGGEERTTLGEVARVSYYRPDTFPADFQSELMVTRHYVPRDYPFAFTNGIQASYLEVDVETGFIKLLKHWCVEDCGTVINPQLVDEQIRGGIVQGLGGALFEHCIYSEDGQLLNGTMADYLVPMAAELPDIECAHVVSMTSSSELGAKGAGEAGTAGAPAVVMNALNDALSPFAAKVSAQPFTPQKILQALGKL
ncbi:xanthine dehydrogenase family protein molybdopterin-binding subunit [Pseudomonadota bacterium]